MSASKPDESVLTISRSQFDLLGSFQGFNPDIVTYGDLREHEDLSYVPRSQCESDVTRKQLIPYVVFASRRGKVLEFLSYQRTSKGGEGRLFEKYSIGFGGHLNDQDETYNDGLLREMTEELVLPPRLSEIEAFPLVGLVNDDSDAVGRVHLGFVHLCLCTPEEEVQLQPEDRSHHNLEWRPASTLVEDLQLETWSQRIIMPMIPLTVEHLIREAIKPRPY